MLVLTRKVGEAIVIEGGITIVIKEIRRGQVRIGVLAPNDTKIYREEIYLQLLDTDDEE